MIVKQCTDHDHDAWDQFVLNSPNGSFFHQTAWKRVIDHAFGYPSAYFFAEERGEISGVLPLFHVKDLLGRGGLISVPFGVSGGVVAGTQLAGVRLLEKAMDRAKSLGVHYLELRHNTENGFDLPTKDLYALFKREIFSTDEENLQAIPRKQRRMVRQGIKFNLESQLGGEELLADFYRVYTTSLRNLGTPAFSYHYFELLLKEFKQQCRILTVQYQGNVAAAVLTFFFKDQVLPYYGGGLPEFCQYAVYDFMYWELMRHARQLGFKIFDFGRSKRGTGAFDFKRHWGFEPQPLPYQYYLPKGGSIPDINPLNPKLQIFISAWKNLPLPVANFLGPKIIKYLP